MPTDGAAAGPAVTAPASGALGGVPAAELVEMLRQMWLIRAFDSGLPKLYTQGVIRGSSHAALGQEDDHV